MSLQFSSMLALGTKAPDFQLMDTRSDQILTYQEVRGETGTLIMFICNHCPFVVHVNPELIRLAHDYKMQGFNLVAISSNDIVNYPQDSPEKMKELAEELNYPFPYLYDDDQSVARMYKAECTPDFFLFDGSDKLVYRGQLDDSRPGNGVPVNGRSIREAMDAILKNAEVPLPQKPSMGCNIKWK